MQHYMNLNHTKPSVRGHNYIHHDISLLQFISGNTRLKLKKTSWNKYYYIERKHTFGIEKDKLAQILQFQTKFETKITFPMFL